MESATKMESAKVQHVTKASSDELLKKFAEVGSETDAKKELRLSKRRKTSHRKIRDGEHCDQSLLVERKSRSMVVIRQLGIGRAKLRARDFKNMSFLGTIEKTWRRTVEGASKVFMEKHYNRHKRLISDIAY